MLNQQLNIKHAVTKAVMKPNEGFLGQCFSSAINHTEPKSIHIRNICGCKDPAEMSAELG